MKLAYYRRIGLSNGKADGRKARNYLAGHSECEPRKLRESRLDSLDCEIYDAELTAYVESYRQGWDLFQTYFRSPL